MKNISYFLLLISLVFLFNTCEENGFFFPASENGTFEVSFDGETFSTSNTSFTSDGKDIIITAIDQETNEIFTVKVDDFGIGSFSFEGGSTVGSYVKNDLVSADIWTTVNETSSRGTIEFTNIDFVNNRVSGRFNFIGRNGLTNSSKAFLDGNFKNIPKAIVPVTNNRFTAKVDGVAYEDLSPFASLSPPPFGSTEVIIISANKSLTETIGLTLQSDIAVGEYDFGSFITLTYPIAQYNFALDTYFADGKITITNHDTNTKFISGTFQFNASPLTGGTPNFSITEGAFSVSY